MLTNWQRRRLHDGEKRNRGAPVEVVLRIQHAGSPRFDGLSQRFEAEAGAGQLQMRDLKHGQRAGNLLRDEGQLATESE